MSEGGKNLDYRYEVEGREYLGGEGWAYHICTLCNEGYIYLETNSDRMNAESRTQSHDFRFLATVFLLNLCLLVYN